MSYKNYAVLFVDDEINVLTSLKRGLIEEEFTCYYTGSGKEALRVLEQKEVAVVVSDMRMPEMNGLELLKKIKDKWPRIVTIVLSGFTQLQQILPTINQVEVFRYITKPWKLEEEFKQVLYEALDYYKLRESNEKNYIALTKQNQVYQSMIQTLDKKIIHVIQYSQILGACGNAILDYSKKLKDSYNEEIMGYMQKIYDDFLTAVHGEEMEWRGQTFADKITKFLEGKLKVSIENKLHQDFRLRCNITILEAILTTCIHVFNKEFLEWGLFVHFEMSKEDSVVLTIASIKTFTDLSLGMHQTYYKLNEKIELLNSILGTALNQSKFSFFASKTDNSLVIFISVNA
jgi:CheY-like chemotaxis protein